MYHALGNWLIDSWKRPGIHSHEAFFQKSQWWSAEQLRAYQMEKLARLLDHCRKNVPYYTQFMKNRTPDLREMPFLTKEIINNNRDALRATNYPDDRLYISGTGGSTGEPMNFYRNKDLGATVDALVYRARKWWGFNPGMRYALIWGNSFEATKHANLARRLSNHVKNSIFLNAHQLDDNVVAELLKEIQRFRPKVIWGYAGALGRLSQYALDHGISFELRCAISTAETLYPNVRQLIAQAFHCDVFDYYGSGEVGSIAFECNTHECYHVSDEHVLLEVVDDQGRPAKPGEIGSVVVTDLDNFGMPFVRYLNRDLAVLGPEKSCSCGRGLSRLARVEGRVSDFIFTPEGKIIHPTYLMYLFYRDPDHANRLEGIRSYKIIQNTISELLVLLQLEPGYGDETKHYVYKNFATRFPSMRIEVQAVEEIPVSKSGKRRYVESNISASNFSKITSGRKLPDDLGV